jgi:hypothetical protein
MMRSLFTQMGILGELLQFLWSRKLYWLIPMILVLLVFALLIILANAGPAAPFIYTLF